MDTDVLFVADFLKRKKMQNGSRAVTGKKEVSYLDLTNCTKGRLPTGSHLMFFQNFFSEKVSLFLDGDLETHIFLTKKI